VTQLALKATVVRDDGRFHLDVVEARSVRDIELGGLALIALDRLGLTPQPLTAAGIKREPRFANANTVWAYRLYLSIGIRMRVLMVLQEDWLLRLACLLTRVRDPVPASMVQACSISSS
jgi:hypothetical protein